MGWKPKKERELTLEEALDAARKELAPLWFNSPPLLSPVRHDGRVTAHPLEETFAEKKWLILFFDPYTFGGEYALNVVREWRRRYEDNDIEFMLVLKPAHPAFFSPRVLQLMFVHHKINYPVMLDLQTEAVGALSASFGVTEFPAVVLLAEKKLQFRFQGRKWYEPMEKAMQDYIRSSDPGCPFYPVIDHSVVGRSDSSRLDFGARFGAVNTGTTHLTFTGQWAREAERLVTQDAAASIRFDSPSSRVAMIAQAILQEKHPKVSVSVGGRPPGEGTLGAIMQADEDGSAFFRIDPLSVYHPLHGLSPGNCSVLLKFGNADRCPVAVYSLLFGD